MEASSFFFTGASTLCWRVHALRLGLAWDWLRLGNDVGQVGHNEDRPKGEFGWVWGVQCRGCGLCQIWAW